MFALAGTWASHVSQNTTAGVGTQTCRGKSVRRVTLWHVWCSPLLNNNTLKTLCSATQKSSWKHSTPLFQHVSFLWSLQLFALSVTRLSELFISWWGTPAARQNLMGIHAECAIPGPKMGNFDKVLNHMVKRGSMMEFWTATLLLVQVFLPYSTVFLITKNICTQGL